MWLRSLSARSLCEGGDATRSNRSTQQSPRQWCRTLREPHAGEQAQLQARSGEWAQQAAEVAMTAAPGLVCAGAPVQAWSMFNGAPFVLLPTLCSSARQAQHPASHRSSRTGLPSLRRCHCRCLSYPCWRVPFLAALGHYLAPGPLPSPRAIGQGRTGRVCPWARAGCECFKGLRGLAAARLCASALHVPVRARWATAPAAAGGRQFGREPLSQNVAAAVHCNSGVAGVATVCSCRCLRPGRSNDGHCFRRALTPATAAGRRQALTHHNGASTGRQDKCLPCGLISGLISGRRDRL